MLPFFTRIPQHLKFICLLLLLPVSQLFGQGAGNTLPLNGTTEWVNLPTAVGDSIRTIEAWFKLNTAVGPSNSNVYTLVARDYGTGSSLSLREFGIYIGDPGGTSGNLYFFRRDNSTLHKIMSDRDSWEADRWYHVAGVIDTALGMQLYINGVLQAETNPSTVPVREVGTAFKDIVGIGAWGSREIRFFPGEIDEVRFWYNGRNQTEIRDNMCQKVDPTNTDLLAYYPFDMVSGTIVNDIAQNGFSGTVTNNANPTWVYSGAPIGDFSVHEYTNISNTIIWTGQDFQWEASNGTGNSDGMHLYVVNALPNTTVGIGTPVAGIPYAGVFLTESNGNFDVAFSSIQPNSICEQNCVVAFSRNDNAGLNWTSIGGFAVSNDCAFELQNESQVGTTWRGEYYVSLNEEIVPPPLPDRIFICRNGSQELDAGAWIFDPDYLWSTGETTQAIEVEIDGKYVVTISWPCGEVVDSVYVVKGEDMELEIPNVISPNGDGINDEFWIKLPDRAGEPFALRILNRWGSEVYYTEDKNARWDGTMDGTLVPDGVYYYAVRTRNCTGRLEWHSGSLTLMR